MPVPVRVQVVHPVHPCPPPRLVRPVVVTAITSHDDHDPDVTWNDANALRYIPSWFTRDCEVF